MPPVEVPREKILGVRFFCGSAAEAVEHFLHASGYMVVPASPALIKLRYDEEYRRALQNADLALADSGLLVALWRIVTGRKLKKVSGIAYLRCLLERDDIRSAGNFFWVVSSEHAKAKAIQWLRERTFEIKAENVHVAPRGGGATKDHALLLGIEKQRAKNIVIALGAGTQEKLGLYLREYLLQRPNIHCVGAALGFLTGEERPIPEWAERCRLGWLFRLLAQPRMLLPRIGIAFVLAGMVLKHRSELPPLKTRWAEV
jgi:N-acetylglucosaminyldiphosphoundecaprenol N-acetyl-beta-D-mannosaminyltransferase